MQADGDIEQSTDDSGADNCSDGESEEASQSDSDNVGDEEDEWTGFDTGADEIDSSAQQLAESEDASPSKQESTGSAGRRCVKYTSRLSYSGHRTLHPTGS